MSHNFNNISSFGLGPLPESWVHTPYYDASHSIHDNNTFPSGQQDFVPFDEGPDFNDREDQKHIQQTRDIAGQATPGFVPNESKFRPKGNDGTPATDNSSITRPSMAISLPGLSSQKLVMTSSDRAAELRAKLIAQQRASATPTPSSLTKKGSAAQSQANAVVSNVSAVEAATATQGLKDIVRSEQQVLNNQSHQHGESFHQSPRHSEQPSPQHGTSEADIEGLIAYGKAIADANGTFNRNPTTTEVGLEESHVRAKEQSPMDNNNTRRQRHISPFSSEASELGEIKEDALPTFVDAEQSLKGGVTFSRSNIGNQENTTVLNSIRTMSNIKVSASEPTREPEASDNGPQNAALPMQGSNRTSENIKPTMTQAENPQHVRTNHHFPFPTGQQSLQLTSTRDEKNQSPLSPIGKNKVPTSAYNLQVPKHQSQADALNKSHNATPDRDIISQDHSPAKIDIASHGGRGAPLIPNCDNVGPSDDLSVGSTARTMKVSSRDLHTASEQLTSNGADTVDAAVGVDLLEHGTKLDASVFASHQILEDVSDWLELTGYHDSVHRIRRLEIHRKKRTLDMQRAELEREEQKELEQHSRSLRASSLFSSRSPETKSSSIFSRLIRTPGPSRMPPPPIPMKDEIGIKIKNAAYRETQTPWKSVNTDQSNNNDTNSFSDPLNAAKRQQPHDPEIEEGSHPAKIQRLENGNKLQDKQPLLSPVKDQSLKSRVSRIIEPRSADYRRRSRSPELAIPRRASDTGEYPRYQKDVPRASMYSPSISRHPSPSRRSSVTKRDLNYSDNINDAKYQDERESQYQRYTPNYHRGRSRGRGYGIANQRGGFKPYGARGGTQGRACGSEPLDLQNGGQSRT